MNCPRTLYLLTCLLAAGGGMGQCNPNSTPLPPLPLPEWDASRFPWPMYGQNVRRTGQSPFNGPATATAGGSRNWTYDAVGGGVIDLQAVVTDLGVYFGTWGVLRRDQSLTPDMWDKSDGRWYGLKLDRQGLADEQELFDPLLPAPTPVGYLLAGRTKLARDVFFTGVDNDYLVSFYNGTIEGTPCIDPDDGTQYVGRGDGRLFAIDPTAGTVKWTFQTFNPENPTDPDGGGEIIGGPVMGPGKIVYFGTVGLPWPDNPPNSPGYETNAVYAVDTQGSLVWRYPSATASLANWIYTPPVISPDGRTLYVGTYAGDFSITGQILAIDLTQPVDMPDAQRLKWSLDVEHRVGFVRRNVYVRHIAVGIDGRLYCCGLEPQLGGASPAVFAVDDLGTSGRLAWNGTIVEPQGYPSSTGQFCNGIALRETNGRLDLVYATVTHLRNSNGEAGGLLYAIDPASGMIRHSFDPGTLPTPGIGGATAPTLGADGTIYFGVRGKHVAGADAAVNGWMYAVRYDAVAGFSLVWSMEVSGVLDWVPPAIGADGGLFFGSAEPINPAEQIFWFAPNATPPNRCPRFYAVFE